MKQQPINLAEVATAIAAFLNSVTQNFFPVPPICAPREINRLALLHRMYQIYPNFYFFPWARSLPEVRDRVCIYLYAISPTSSSK